MLGNSFKKYFYKSEILKGNCVGKKTTKNLDQVKQKISHTKIFVNLVVHFIFNANT